MSETAVFVAAVPNGGVSNNGATRSDAAMTPASCRAAKACVPCRFYGSAARPLALLVRQEESPRQRRWSLGAHRQCRRSCRLVVRPSSFVQTGTKHTLNLAALPAAATPTGSLDRVMERSGALAAGSDRRRIKMVPRQRFIMVECRSLKQIKMMKYCFVFYTST